MTRVLRVLIACCSAAAVTAGLAQGAMAQANCDWYAKIALEQQKQNVDRKCGFTGPSWTSDRASHMQWCQSVGPDQWKRQAQFRDQELAKCSPRR